MRDSLLLLSLFVLMTMVLPHSAQAAEACRTTWEYQIVDLDAADSVRVKAKQRGAASSGLIANLNRLGGQGWELTSEHQIRVYEEFTDVGPSSNAKAPQSDWVAELNPSAALFRRATSACPPR